MVKVFALFCLLILTGCSRGLDAANCFLDELESTREVGLPLEVADTYKHALQIWKTAEDVNAWITTNFSYDTARAIQLSETQRRKNGQFSIYPPSVLFESKTGVCVDLARFGVETLKNIDPRADPKYVMIEFDPMRIQGNTLRLHWLVSFRRDGKTYFFADSKRPGYIAGPYSDPQAFINDYQQYRGRRIITFRELESCEKQERTRARKKQRARSPNDAIQRMRSNAR